MKKIIGLAITLLLLLSCENHCVESYYAIVNNSGKNVEISTYKINIYSGETTFSKKLIIHDNSKHENILKDCTGQVGKFTFHIFVDADSIAIDYGDRVQGYSTRGPKDKIERNPYYLDGLNKSNDFIYTLTPEDYANATPKP